MHRILVVLLLLSGTATAFGNGPIEFTEYTLPGNASASEPTIGIPWNTDNLFYHTFVDTLRAEFDAGGNATWTDVTPPYQVPINLDPMLIADEDTGRITAGGLHGACSVMMYSDDDGGTWLPTGNMCSGAWFDHQSIGSGPHPTIPSTAQTQANYYCAQLGQIACASSTTGGVAWGPFQPVTGDCGGFNGHIRVSRATGFMAVPVADCGTLHGFISTADGGLTYQSNTIPGTDEWTNGFDPSLQFSRPSGWMYYGMASEHGINIGLTKDEGATWEAIGSSHGNATTWLDVGVLHDPPIVAGTFADVQVGDDDRAAFTFLGIEDNGSVDLQLLASNGIYRCDVFQEELVWYYYTAFTYDAGQTWKVIKMSDDPVQVGGIYDSVVGGGGGCRNLLDFNDSDIDSEGRLYVGWADGCIEECATSKEPGTAGYRTDLGKIFRQSGGRGLFAAYDLPELDFPDLDNDGIPDDQDDDIDGDGIRNEDDDDPVTPRTNSTPEKDSPGFGLLAGLAAVGLALRRRS